MRRTSLLATLLVAVTPVFADDPSFDITIKEHRFTPSEITIPKDTKVWLVVINQDATAEEFESHSLHREKVIPGNSRAVIRIGPLAPGSYEFVGEFHEDTARGTLIVK
jgi:Cupredoxin-like domain